MKIKKNVFESTYSKEPISVTKYLLHMDGNFVIYGWKLYNRNRSHIYYYSKIYHGSNICIDIENNVLVVNTHAFSNTTIEKNDFDCLKNEANLLESDEFIIRCFKIANYICSRLCDKIEK